jgi:hypothetical protein
MEPCLFSTFGSRASLPPCLSPTTRVVSPAPTPRLPNCPPWKGATWCICQCIFHERLALLKHLLQRSSSSIIGCPQNRFSSSRPPQSDPPTQPPPLTLDMHPRPILWPLRHTRALVWHTFVAARVRLQFLMCFVWWVAPSGDALGGCVPPRLLLLHCTPLFGVPNSSHRFSYRQLSALLPFHHFATSFAGGFVVGRRRDRNLRALQRFTSPCSPLTSLVPPVKTLCCLTLEPPADYSFKGGPGYTYRQRRGKHTDDSPRPSAAFPAGANLVVNPCPRLPTNCYRRFDSSTQHPPARARGPAAKARKSQRWLSSGATRGLPSIGKSGINTKIPFWIVGAEKGAP